MTATGEIAIIEKDKITESPKELIGRNIGSALVRFVIGLYSIRNYVTGFHEAVTLKDLDELIIHYQRRAQSAELDVESGIESSKVHLKKSVDTLNILKKARKSRPESRNKDSELEMVSEDKFVVEIGSKKFYCDPSLMPSYDSNFSNIFSGRREILNRSSLIQIISTYEMFIANMLHAYYRNFPGTLNNKEVKITIEEMKKIGGFEDYLQHVIDEEVEGFMMQSVEYWAKFFQKIGIDYEKTPENWANFREYFYRRNIIVHNDGIVNKRYLKNIKNLKIKVEQKDGQRIVVTLKYIEDMIEDILIAGVSFGFSTWHNFDKENDNKFALMQDMIYNSLQQRDWRLAEALCNQSDMLTDSLELKLINYMNRVLCKKKRLGKKEIEEELSKFSHSTSHPNFSAVVYALSGEHDKFFDILPKTDIDIGSLIEWPVLEEMRQDIRYNLYLLNKIADLKDGKIKEVGEQIFGGVGNLEPEPSLPPLESFTIKDLKDKCKELNLLTTTKMRKKDLILLIQSRQGYDKDF